MRILALMLLLVAGLQIPAQADATLYEFWLASDEKAPKNKAVKKGKLGFAQILKNQSGKMSLVFSGTSTPLEGSHTILLLQEYEQAGKRALIGTMSSGSFVFDLYHGYLQWFASAAPRYFALVPKNKASWQGIAPPVLPVGAPSPGAQSGKSKTSVANHVAQQLHYPKSARDGGFSGMVVVKAWIAADGKTTLAQLERSASFALDVEALRLALLLPAQAPATDEAGAPLGSWLSFPVTFILN